MSVTCFYKINICYHNTRRVDIFVLSIVYIGLIKSQHIFKKQLWQSTIQNYIVLKNQKYDHQYWPCPWRCDVARCSWPMESKISFTCTCNLYILLPICVSSGVFAARCCKMALFLPDHHFSPCNTWYLSITELQIDFPPKPG